jgi:uncharacterized protein involved in exopolysaccharide biosynthesis
LEKEAELFNASDFVIESPLLGILRKTLSEISVELSGMKTDIKESHPDFISLKNKHDKIKDNINVEVERIVNSHIKHHDTLYEKIRQQLVNFIVERQSIQASLQSYEMIIDSIAEQIQNMPSLIAHIDSLTSDLQKYQAMLRTLEINLEETNLQRKSELLNIVVVEEATPPDKPSFPVLWLNILVAGLAGFIGGISYSFFVNYLEETREQRLYRLLKAIEDSER